ncbi:MAG: hypothetical protein RMI63_01665 [Caldimicrobium sp.]|nr:hypothetical protein [Caldimicrobium sp.]MDW8093713.1 hypothetical protein [Caldimicrobium sp.]
MSNLNNKKHAIPHLFLVKASNQKEALNSAESFIQRYQLIRYEEFQIKTEQIVVATSLDFWLKLNEALQINKRIIFNIIKEIKLEGYTTLEDLKDLPQGYLSKLVHTLAHLLDGFFGIDSYFYNLIEDSHFISSALMKTIKNIPENFYLIPWIGFISEPKRRFELLNPKKFIK